MASFANRAAKRFLRVLGRSIKCTHYVGDFVFADHLARLFDRLEVGCVLDVGAFNGLYHDFLRDMVGYRGLIISFEPVRKYAEALKRDSARDPQWVICDFALGSEDSHGTFNVMRAGNFSSFLPPDHSVVSDFAVKNQVDHQETVQVRRLDSVIGSLASRRPIHNIYLKMDTQGFDLEVIRGAPETLRTVLALQTEMSLRPIYQGMPSFSDARRELESLGFDISGMFPVSHDTALRLIEFDCVMVNRLLIRGQPD